MGILTPSSLATVGLVLAVELLSSVSARAPSDVRLTTRSLAASIGNVVDRNSPLFACIVPPAATDEAVSEPGDPPCTTWASRAPFADVQMTGC
jgi:hypothetical protein